MQAQQLWNVILASGIPGAQLKDLGYDLYFARKEPTGDGVKAVKTLASKIGVEPPHMYAAMNVDPGRHALEAFADDYKHDRHWEKTSAAGRAYVERVAQRIAIIQKAAAPKPVQSPKPAAPIVTKRTFLAPVVTKPAIIAPVPHHSFFSYGLVAAMIGSMLYFLMPAKN